MDKCERCGKEIKWEKLLKVVEKLRWVENRGESIKVVERIIGSLREYLCEECLREYLMLERLMENEWKKKRKEEREKYDLEGWYWKLKI